MGLRGGGMEDIKGAGRVIGVVERMEKGKVVGEDGVVEEERAREVCSVFSMTHTIISTTTTITTTTTTKHSP